MKGEQSIARRLERELGWDRRSAIAWTRKNKHAIRAGAGTSIGVTLEQSALMLARRELAMREWGQ